MSSSETVEVGGVAIQAWREYMSGEIGWTQFTGAVVDALNAAATKPTVTTDPNLEAAGQAIGEALTAAEKETDVKDEQPVFEVGMKVRRTSGTGRPGEVRSGVEAMPDGKRICMVKWDTGLIKVPFAFNIEYVADLVADTTLPLTPTPSPQAQAAAQDVCNKYDEFFQLCEADIAAIIDKHTRSPERDRVLSDRQKRLDCLVEAAKRITDDIPVGATLVKPMLVNGRWLRELAEAVDALAAKEAGK